MWRKALCKIKEQIYTALNPTYYVCLNFDMQEQVLSNPLTVLSRGIRYSFQSKDVFHSFFTVNHFVESAVFCPYLMRLPSNTEQSMKLPKENLPAHSAEKTQPACQTAAPHHTVQTRNLPVQVESEPR